MIDFQMISNSYFGKPDISSLKTSVVSQRARDMVSLLKGTRLEEKNICPLTEDCKIVAPGRHKNIRWP